MRKKCCTGVIIHSHTYTRNHYNERLIGCIRWPCLLCVMSIFWCTLPLLILPSWLLDLYEISFIHLDRNQSSHAKGLAGPKLSRVWIQLPTSPVLLSSWGSLMRCGCCCMQTAIWNHRWELGAGWEPMWMNYSTLKGVWLFLCQRWSPVPNP